MTRSRFWPLAILLILINGCVTLRPKDEVTTNTRQKGLASWYGEEFAGRATANGEIFDPMQLTAAHRTLPFGTVVEVKNTKSGQVIMVRINDRGPYIGNRIIDLSYAAAEKLGMVNDGVSEVELRVLKVGAGDREAPVPLVVSAGDPPRAVKRSSDDDAPAVAFPLPQDVATNRSGQSAAPGSNEPIVDRVEVVEERGGVETRKQVSADGRTVENAPIAAGDQRELGASSAAALDEREARRASSIPVTKQTIVLQLGAFQSIDNANALADKARAVAPKVYVEKFNELNRVRVGPFPTREKAVEMKEKLDTAGISSIVVTE